MASNVLALIPAREGSKGIPGKNFRDLGNGSPVALACRCAHAAGLRPIITTDRHNWGPFQRNYPYAGVLLRPSALAQDDTPMIDVVQHALSEIPGPADQIMVLLQPTQPFRKPEHVTTAIDLLRNMEWDSVVSLTPIPRTHAPSFALMYSNATLTCSPWIGEWRERPTRRQDVPWPYVCDGTVYAFYRRTVETHGNIFGELVGATIIPPDETCPLDTEADWLEAERRLRAV